ncbi:MAG: cytochrome b [Rhizobiaceae bacterium]|nr:cytochrome b [Rhizobiaceae bacterium]
MIRNTKSSWGLVSILFHWTMAALFLGQFWLGWHMQGVRSLFDRYTLVQWHKSLGFLILGLAVLRLIWAVTSRRPELPEAMPAGERALARGSHVALYVALFLVPSTGWAVVSASPLPIASRFFGLFVVPSLPTGVSLHTQQLWSSLHGFLAYAAIFLVGVHALAAFRHHVRNRDGVLMRMIRPR